MNDKLHLPRRTFLKGLGAAMALPMLDIMRPAAAAAGTAAQSPTRLAFIFVPNGVIQPAWKPTGTGVDFQFGPTLEPLAPLKSEVLVFSGLAQDNGRDKGDGAGDHARSASSFLTGAHPYKTSGANIRVGVSVDQVAADRIGRETRLPSLELGTERGRNAGDCDSGYSCAYSNNVSWKSATTPMAKEVNPRLVFERLFGSPDADPDARARRNHFRKSILDVVADDADRLKGRLGKTDRHKIDEYFTSVRELEARIARAEQAPRQQPPEFAQPAGVPEVLEDHIRLMFDLLALAFQTDTTRVATYMLANAGSNRSYEMVGVKEGHHSLSHHGDDVGKVQQLQKIDLFLMTQYAYFLEKLRSTADGDGTLLDHSMILYGSGLGDGNHHTHHDLPIVLAGRGGGTLEPGRHIAFEQEAPLNNLFLSLLDRVGADVDKLGDSSGRLTGLDG